MIRIDNTRPFEPFVSMTTHLWMQLPCQPVRINDLVWCQTDVSIQGMLETITVDYKSYSGDPFPHVVVFNGNWYLSDGHHRVLVAVIRGQSHVEARVLHVWG